MKHHRINFKRQLQLSPTHTGKKLRALYMQLLTTKKTNLKWQMEVKTKGTTTNRYQALSTIINLKTGRTIKRHSPSSGSKFHTLILLKSPWRVIRLAPSNVSLLVCVEESSNGVMQNINLRIVL